MTEVIRMIKELPGFRITVHEDSIVFTVLKGHINGQTKDSLLAAIERESCFQAENLQKYRAVVIDFSECHLYSSGISFLLFLQKKYGRLCPGKQLFIYLGKNETARKVFQVSHVYSVVHEVPLEHDTLHKMLAYVKTQTV
ncbi:MAG: hypothetical protein ABIH38_00475 [Patescibacteria group bacterium]